MIGSDGSDPRPLLTTLIQGTKILLASPVDGHPESAMCALGYAVTAARLLSEHREIALTEPEWLCYPTDVVRARSRAVMHARMVGATGVFWLDTDTVPKEGTLAAMLATGLDVVGCPYPRKRMHWDRVKHALPEESPEWHAYDYCYHFDNPKTETAGAVATVDVQNGCTPVARMGFGCMYTSIKALNAVWDAFAEDDWFTDVVNGKHYDCVAVFGLLFSQTGEVRGKRFRALYSEDYSFCERYGAVCQTKPELGLTPAMMMVSHPADHVGQHRFRGSAEGLVYAQ